MIEFTAEDIRQIEKKGLSAEKVRAQLEVFEHGIPPVKLHHAATTADGIVSLSDDQQLEYVKLYEKSITDLKIVKFVPASGEATRMFKFLFSFLSDFDDSEMSAESYLQNRADEMLRRFIDGMQRLPFYKEVESATKSRIGRDSDLSGISLKVECIRTMVDPNLLNMAGLPKGLIGFHSGENRNICPLEEHLKESINYAASGGKAFLHFTISEKHKNKFQSKLDEVLPEAETVSGIEFHVDFSFQDPATDTIAADLNNEPFRLENGQLLFRPSGHGALLKNLDSIIADIVFIKNIDNVVVSKYRDEIGHYKKLLGGILIDCQKEVYHWLRRIDSGQISETEEKELLSYMSNILNIRIIPGKLPSSQPERLKQIHRLLNRPIRICGMVKNEGEPGGGPFWVKGTDNSVSLQIVEASQVDKDAQDQITILNNATHFNPVDLCCGLKDYKGQPFELHSFVDENTAFISEKTHSGKPLKALERPGLWNGSMANWTTVFVEVPLVTFNPVKTVADLLKPTHQGS